MILAMVLPAVEELGLMASLACRFHDISRLHAFLRAIPPECFVYSNGLPYVVPSHALLAPTCERSLPESETQKALSTTTLVPRC